MKKVAAVVALMGVCLLMVSGLAMAGQDQQPLPPPVLLTPPTPMPAPVQPVPLLVPPPAAPMMAPTMPMAQPQMPAGQGGGGSAAVVLSIVMPGAGEWMNGNFEGPFPTIECCAGYLCPIIMWSSVLDAAIGDRSDRVRIDFWTKPRPER